MGIAPDRRFVMEAQLGLLMGKKVHPRYVFLFSDLIVYAKPNQTVSTHNNPMTFRGKFLLSDVRQSGLKETVGDDAEGAHEAADAPRVATRRHRDATEVMSRRSVYYYFCSFVNFSPF